MTCIEHLLIIEYYFYISGYVVNPKRYKKNLSYQLILKFNPDFYIYIIFQLLSTISLNGINQDAKSDKVKQTSTNNKDSDPKSEGAIKIKLNDQRYFKYKINLTSFDIVRFQGNGAFGRVYKVRQKQTKKKYAMKVQPKDLLFRKNQIKYAKTEAHILEVSNHPFILSQHFSFQTPHHLYMVVDYCSGGDQSLLLIQHLIPVIKLSRAINFFKNFYFTLVISTETNKILLILTQ